MKIRLIEKGFTSQFKHNQFDNIERVLLEIDEKTSVNLNRLDNTTWEIPSQQKEYIVYTCDFQGCGQCHKFSDFETARQYADDIWQRFPGIIHVEVYQSVRCYGMTREWKYEKEPPNAE